MPIEHTRSRVYWYHKDHGLLPRGDSPIPNHVQFVREHDALFDLPAGYVDETFKMDGEPIGTEGHAREAVLAMVMRKGWVRIREWPRSLAKMWYVQVHDVEQQREHLQMAMQYIADKVQQGDRFTLIDRNGQAEYGVRDLLGLLERRE